jgi:protocatechuate 3,4-dioxygenase beta subunit
MDAAPGVEMQLHLRILDSKNTMCNAKGVPDVDVYIWHTDAQGYYSGFGLKGTDTQQNPDMPYAGKPGANDLQNTDRFCRGMQTTDANGIVSFRSIFPGWYNGRDLHIHFVAFKKGSMSVANRPTYNKSNSNMMWLFTTQFYFDSTFSKSIHEKNDPYKARTSLSAYNGAMAADEANNSQLKAKATLAGDTGGVGGIITAQMQILLDPA